LVCLQFPSTLDTPSGAITKYEAPGRERGPWGKPHRPPRCAGGRRGVGRSSGGPSGGPPPAPPRRRAEHTMSLVCVVRGLAVFSPGGFQRFFSAGRKSFRKRLWSEECVHLHTRVIIFFRGHKAAKRRPFNYAATNLHGHFFHFLHRFLYTAGWRPRPVAGQLGLIIFLPFPTNL